MIEINKIPVGWIDANLVDNLEALIDYRGKTPEKSDNGILTLSAKSVKMGYIDYSQAYYISKETYDKFMVRGFPKVGDVLMTTEAPLGCIARLDRDDVAIAQRLLTLRGKENILDNDYLRYYLTSRKGQHELSSRASGSTVEGIKRSEFVNVKILLPNINEQKAISKVIRIFDDKIELLQAQNKTLEAIGQTVYAEWYSKYKNGDELPEGWQIDSLEKIANHSKTSIKPFDHPDAEYYHFSLPSYDNGLIPVIEKGEMIKSNKYLVENNSFLVSKLNPFTPRIWTIFDVQQNFICSTEFQVVKPKEELYFSLIHCFLNSDEFTSELSQKIKGTSSSHQRVNPQDIFDAELVIPSENDLINFNSAIYPLLAKKNINHKQIQTLSQTRDELLPGLMTGGIRVNEFKV